MVFVELNMVVVVFVIKELGLCCFIKLVNKLKELLLERGCIRVNSKFFGGKLIKFNIGLSIVSNKFSMLEV